jgi:transcriptional regulator with XRE-family HTH domain
MNSLSEQEILAEVGRRLQRTRLSQNVTQQQLAKRAGVAPRTVSAAEGGEDIRLSTLVRLLRALGRLGGIDALLPAPQVSPLELVERRGKQRKRARGSRGNRREDGRDG